MPAQRTSLHVNRQSLRVSSALTTIILIAKVQFRSSRFLSEREPHKRALLHESVCGRNALFSLPSESSTPCQTGQAYNKKYPKN
jgi:hypothetical protein